MEIIHPGRIERLRHAQLRALYITKLAEPEERQGYLEAMGSGKVQSGSAWARIVTGMSAGWWLLKFNARAQFNHNDTAAANLALIDAVEEGRLDCGPGCEVTAKDAIVGGDTAVCELVCGAAACVFRGLDMAAESLEQQAQQADKLLAGDIKVATESLPYD